jgi:hypothetical protein
VEAQWEAARRLAFSVHLASNLMDSKMITILHNAISNVTGSMLNLRVNPTNAGATRVVSIESCLSSECNKTMVRTITLDNLLPFVFDKSSGFTIRQPQVVMKVSASNSELINNMKNGQRTYVYTVYNSPIIKNLYTNSNYIYIMHCVNS